MSTQLIEKEIRCVLIPMRESWILLPNAVVSEVLNVPPYLPVKNTPTWLIGDFNWREQVVPLVQLDTILGVPIEGNGIGAQSKTIILNSISGNVNLPYIAIISQQIPRLIKVSEKNLKNIPNPIKGEYITKWVRVNDNMALLPDLEKLERTVYKTYVGKK